MTNTNANTEKTIMVTAATGKNRQPYIQKSSLKWDGRYAAVPALPTPVLTGRIRAPGNQHCSTSIPFTPAYCRDLAVPGAVDIIRSFTETAISQGVKKLVLLSGRGEEEAQNCEQIVMNSVSTGQLYGPDGLPTISAKVI